MFKSLQTLGSEPVGNDAFNVFPKICVVHIQLTRKSIFYCKCILNAFYDYSICSLYLFLFLCFMLLLHFCLLQRYGSCFFLFSCSFTSFISCCSGRRLVLRCQNSIANAVCSQLDKCDKTDVPVQAVGRQTHYHTPVLWFSPDF